MSRPAAPAAVSAWPTFDLTEPIAHWPFFQPDWPQSDLRLSISTASPTACPGGVALDQIDVAGAPAGLLVGHPHGPELTLGAGGQQVAVDVVGQADPGHDRVNLIAVRQGIVEALEHEHARPFADHQPIGSLIERSGLAARRQCAKLREPHLRVKRIGARDAAAKHRVGPTGSQFVDGQLERIKRRPACRVDRVGRPTQTQAPERPARPATRPETRSTARSSPCSRAGTPSFSSKTAPRTSRVSSEAVSVGKTILPKTTPTRSRSTPLGLCIAPRLPRHVECEMKDRVEPLEERWVEVKPFQHRAPAAR